MLNAGPRCGPSASRATTLTRTSPRPAAATGARSGNIIPSSPSWPGPIPTMPLRSCAAASRTRATRRSDASDRGADRLERLHAIARQQHGDPGAGVRPAGDLDRAAVQFDEAAGERQAQPGAGVAPRQRAVDLDERIEDPVEIAFGDADAAVGHDQLQALVGPGNRADADPSAGRRELDRVGDQVQQHLLELGLIRPKLDLLVGEMGLEREAGLPGALAKEPLDAGNQGRDRSEE